MARHLKLVRGGGDGTVMCACNKVIERIRGQVEVTCSCTEQKYFTRMPERWICDYCSRNRHERYGQRQ